MALHLKWFIKTPTSPVRSSALALYSDLHHREGERPRVRQDEAFIPPHTHRTGHSVQSLADGCERMLSASAYTNTSSSLNAELQLSCPHLVGISISSSGLKLGRNTNKLQGAKGRDTGGCGLGLWHVRGLGSRGAICTNSYLHKIYKKHNLSRKIFIPSLCPGLPAGFPA